jgi:ComF family protein
MLKDFFSLLYPQFCLACEQNLEGGEEVICTTCRFDLPKTDLHKTSNNILAKRFWGKINLTHALAYLYFSKQGKVQELVHNLKYSGHQEIGEKLGKWYGYELAEADFGKEFDLIIPVPLHKNKLKKRGYNQCDTFAQSLSLTLSVPFSSTTLKRITATQTQTDKSRFLRWKNVEEIFVVANESEISGKRVLLVDDVVTTGATLESCGHVLLSKGAKGVSIACIAMAL